MLSVAFLVPECHYFFPNPCSIFICFFLHYPLWFIVVMLANIQSTLKDSCPKNVRISFFKHLCWTNKSSLPSLKASVIKRKVASSPLFHTEKTGSSSVSRCSLRDLFGTGDSWRWIKSILQKVCNQALSVWALKCLVSCLSLSVALFQTQSKRFCCSSYLWVLNRTDASIFSTCVLGFRLLWYLLVIVGLKIQ